MNRLIKAQGLGIKTLYLHKPIGRALPGHGVVLQRALGRASHHQARSPVVKEHPHHVVGRDHMGKPVAKDVVRAGGHNLGVHAGAVVAPHVRNNVAQLGRHAHRGIRRQHTALGVAANKHVVTVGGRHLKLGLQVLYGL